MCFNVAYEFLLFVASFRGFKTLPRSLGSCELEYFDHANTEPKFSNIFSPSNKSFQKWFHDSQSNLKTDENFLKFAIFDAWYLIY